MINKTIWIFWLQGWENAPLLQQEVVESWIINNPGWKIEKISKENIKDYVSDIDYIYDSNKNISPAALSDIVRLSLLKNYGGVWADSTLLCMQPLDSWIHKTIEKSGFWMYHGNGAKMNKFLGPVSWFIVSVKNSYIIEKWKLKVDEYWKNRNTDDNYFWMDAQFRDLVIEDDKFYQLWTNTPYLYSEDDGQSHTLAHHSMFSNSHNIKNLFLSKPPYVLKLWGFWNSHFPTKESYESEHCKLTNAYYAILMSKRGNVTYNHFS